MALARWKSRDNRHIPIYDIRELCDAVVGRAYRSFCSELYGKPEATSHFFEPSAKLLQTWADFKRKVDAFDAVLCQKRWD
jgi:hypothetical protein